MTLSSPDNQLLETRILAELAEIDQKIASLSSDRRALERFLANVRADDLGGQNVTRRNSYSRIMVENKILSTLKVSAPEPVSTKILFATAQIVHYGLKDDTFRSHLHRLKQRGTITNVTPRGRGFWLLIPPAAKET